MIKYITSFLPTSINLPKQKERINGHHRTVYHLECKLLHQMDIMKWITYILIYKFCSNEKISLKNIIV